MARRLPSSPPTLPGFSYVRVLGSGGFADVFLYEQNMPRRQVAVKVLLSEVVTPVLRAQFQAEANVMAQLSAHPSVLTVYQASVSSDGRPYLVMELCSPAGNRRYRGEPVPVPDVLRIGVKIASAIETAHRAGVLHRDVKPSNILMTAYGHPVLSDFGIASTLDERSSAAGLSVPWSAPEVVTGQTSGTIASEIWSLGATLYSLLAGRSPFEVAGGENGTADLLARIQKAKPQPVGREDVPAALEALLRRSLSRKPEARQQSVLEFIRDLQAVEAELGLAQTSLEVAVGDWATGSATNSEDRTRVKGVVDPVPLRRRRRRQITSAQSATRTPAPAMTATATRTPEGRMTRTVAWLIVACAALVVALGATATVVLVRQSSTSDIPTVRNVDGRASAGSVIFSWQDPGLKPGDAYQVQVGDAPPSIQHARQFRVDAVGGPPVCITVTVNRNGRAGAASSEKCVDQVGGP